MRFIVVALVASALAISSVGISVRPTEAGWNDGVYSFGGSTTTMTRTFLDPTPARTPVVLYLQKKPGAQKCSAQVIVTRGGYVTRSQWIYKYTRTNSRGYSHVITWPSLINRTTITVKTNGRCIFGVAVS